VCVIGCPPDQCHNLLGSQRAARRAMAVRKALEELGVEGERIEMYHLERGFHPEFVEAAVTMDERVRDMGASPFKSEVKPAKKASVKPAKKTSAKPAKKAAVKPAKKAAAKPAKKTAAKPAKKAAAKPAKKTAAKPTKKVAAKPSKKAAVKPAKKAAKKGGKKK
jgi:hypothetical protein